MSFLRPIPMAKVRLVGLKEDREAVFTAVHDSGVVQVEPLGKEALTVLEPDRGNETSRTVADQMIRFRALKAALPATPPGVPHAFEDLPAILAAARTVPIDDEVATLKREEDQLLTQRKALTDQIDLLAKYTFYNEPLEILSGRHVVSFFGDADAEKFEALRQELPADAHLVTGPVGDKTGFLVAVPTAEAEAVGRLAQRQQITLTIAPRLTGTRTAALPALEAERQRLEARLTEIAGRLSAIARVWYPTVLAVEEALAIENRKLEAYGRIGVSARTFALEGWVPQRELPQLKAAVDSASAGRTQVDVIPTTERAPTYLENPKGVRRFEFFIRFYALPQSDEWDPTWVFAIVFPIFFGLMLGDVGYGLLILLVCLWIIDGYPGVRRLPKFGRNLVRTIISPWAMREIALTLVPGCFVAIGAGVVFDAFFGAHFYPNPIVDPVSKSSAGTLLLLAGYIGLAMVTLGFALGALKEYFHHHIRGAVGKFGGILFAWGIATVGLSVLRAQDKLATHPLFGVEIGVLVVGVLLMIGGEGIMTGGLGVIEGVSHILSYTRLIGILLASVILALVINSVAHSWLATGAIGLAIGAIVLLVVGQGFNVIVGVFEPGIQGARLLFVENFSKYFEGNGKGFRPLRSNRRYTVAVPPNPAPPPAALPARS